MAKKKAAKKAPKKTAKKTTKKTAKKTTKKTAKKVTKKKTAKKKGVIARVTKGMSDAVEYAGDVIASPFAGKKGKAKKKK